MNTYKRKYIEFFFKQKKLLKKVFFGSKDSNIFEKREFDKSGDETENSLASCSDGSDLDSLSDSSNSLFFAHIALTFSISHMEFLNLSS